MPKLAPSGSTRGGKVLLLAFFVVAACEMGVVGLSLEPESIELDMTDVELEAGHDVLIQATVRDRTGKAITPGRGWGIDWTTSDDRIAAVEAMGKDAARAVAGHGGTAEVTATVVQSVSVAGIPALLQNAVPRGRALGHLKASATVSVGPSDLQYVDGSGQSAAVGSELPGELILLAVDGDGNGVPNVAIEFRVRGQDGRVEPAEAVTDDEGQARTRWTLGEAPGEMSVTAQAAIRRQKLPTIEFTAVAVEEDNDSAGGGSGGGGGSAPARVEVKPEKPTMNALGDTVQLTAIVRDHDGDALTDLEITWSSEDPAVATVDSKGRVAAKAVGSARIVAGVEGVSGDAVVEVRQIVASVAVEPESATLNQGKTEQLSATAADSNGVRVSGASFEWSSSDAAVASVASGGLVTAHEEGAAKITARSGGISGSAQIQVAAPPPPPPPPSGAPAAFPGAQGWGAMALAECRDLPLVVHRVTNTNDSGSGSLRDVLENRVRSNRFDVVVFTTGGRIDLGSHLVARADCIYLAGQTAPGGGVNVAGARTTFTGRDIVIRHMRFFATGSTSLSIWGSRRAVVDHVSAAWGGVGGGNYVLRSTNSDYVTISNSMLYEPLRDHPTVLGLVGADNSSTGGSSISVYRNFIAGPGHRMPHCNTWVTEVVNNVIYNWADRGTGLSNNNECDIVANYYKPGPITRSSGAKSYPMHYNNGCRIGTEFYANEDCIQSTFIARNRSPKNNWNGSLPPDSAWRGSYREVVCRTSNNDGNPACVDNGDDVPLEWKRHAPLAQQSGWPLVRTEISDGLVADILRSAGHSRKLTCDGRWAGARSVMDADRIDRFHAGATAPSNILTDNGFIDRDKVRNAVPRPTAGSACADSDGDGLPDAWEQRFFGCATCADPRASTSSGYLVIEHYLNGTDPR